MVGVVGLLLIGTACSNKNTEPTVSEIPVVEEKQTVEAFGIVKAGTIHNINLEFSAGVQRVHVKEGQRVSKGESLFTLYLGEYQGQIKSLEHELTIANLELAKLLSGSRDEKQTTSGSLQKVQNSLQADQKDVQRLNQEIVTKKTNLQNQTDPDIKKLINDANRGEAVYQKALKQLRDKEVLYKEGAISQHEYDESKRSVEDHKNNMTSIQLSIDTLKFNKQKEIDQLQTVLDQKSAGVKNQQIELSMAKGQENTSVEIQRERIISIEAALERTKSKLQQAFIKDHQVISTVEQGVVYEVGYISGDITTPAKKLLSIMDLDTLMIEANVAEEFIKDVKMGAEVSIIPVGDTSKKYKGKVTKIWDMAVKQNGETVIPIEVSIENKDEFLRPNFNVDVKIAVE